MYIVHVRYSSTCVEWDDIFHVPFWVVTLVQGIRCVACASPLGPLTFDSFPVYLILHVTLSICVAHRWTHTHTHLSLSLPLPPILCLYAYKYIYIYIHMHSFIFYLFLHIWSQFVISYVCCMYVAYVTWQHVRLPPEAAEAAGRHFAGENALQRRWAVHGWC